MTPAQNALEALKAALQTYGLSPDDPKALLSLVADLARGRSKYTRAIGEAVELRVAQDAKEAGSAPSLPALRATLAQRLVDGAGLDLALAEWTVDAWLVGYGVIDAPLPPPVTAAPAAVPADDEPSIPPSGGARKDGTSGVGLAIMAFGAFLLIAVGAVVILRGSGNSDDPYVATRTPSTIADLPPTTAPTPTATPSKPATTVPTADSPGTTAESPPKEPASEPESRPTPDAAPAAGPVRTSFPGFSVEVPSGFSTSTEARDGWMRYHLVGGGGAEVQIDRYPHSDGDGDPMTTPAGYDRKWSAKPDYRRIRLDRDTFQGSSSVVFEFTRLQEGVALHKRITYFKTDAYVWAIILVAPPDRWDASVAALEVAQESFRT